MNLIHELADELFDGDEAALFDFILKCIPDTWSRDVPVPPIVADFIRKQRRIQLAQQAHEL